MSITNSWLQEVKLNQLLENRDGGDLVRVYPGSTLDDACRVMAKNHILSAPVFDLKSGLYVGFFDVLELVKYVCEESNVRKFYAKGDPSSSSANWNFSSAIIRDVLRKSNRCNEIAILPHNIGLWEAIAQLRLKYHQHRILVNRIGTGDYQLLSQSDLVRFLDKNREKLVDVINMKVDQMSLQHMGVPAISIFSTEKAVDGFYKMACHNAQCVAILDQATGKLVADISPADLRGIISETFHLLHLPVTEFLNKIAGKTPPVTCNQSTCLGDIITKVVQTHIHHLWVVDDQDKPLAVVTLTDILYSLFRVLQS